jgi:hypothetical protein
VGIRGLPLRRSAPAFGLPPQPPGVPVADIYARQLWWVAAVGSMAIALWLLLDRRKPVPVRLGGLLVAILPDAIGAPSAKGVNSVPASLIHQFALVSILTTGIFWIALGSIGGLLYQRFGYADDRYRDALTFPARAITTGVLGQIGSAFRKSATVHSQRSLTSFGVALNLDPQNPLSYQVLEATADGWMRVRSMNEGVEGWIYANEALQSQDLARNLPESKFVDGAIGYLEAAKAVNPAAMRGRARLSLESFAAAGSQDTHLATATAKSMQAVMFAHDIDLRARLSTGARGRGAGAVQCRCSKPGARVPPGNLQPRHLPAR